MYCLRVKDGMTASFASFTFVTHLESRGSGYPHPLLFFERGWPPLPLITYLKVEGVAIPIYFSFWIMGGRLLHVLYCNALCRIIPYDQVSQSIVRYSTILCYTILYYIILFCTVLSHTIMYSVLFRHGMTTSSTFITHHSSRGSGYPHPLFQFKRWWPPPPLIPNIKVESVAISTYFSCWGMGDSLLRVLYYNVLYCIIQHGHVLQCIILYYTIRCYIIL